MNGLRPPSESNAKLESDLMKTLLDKAIASHLQAVNAVHDNCREQICAIAETIEGSLARGGKILFFGNGGSAADAQHLAAEFVVRYREDRKALPAIALTTDSSLLTACSNDLSFADVFARQIQCLARNVDVVVGISTSGSSENIVNGLATAKEIGATTVAFVGDKPNACGSQSDYVLTVPHHETARIQECHILVGHILCEYIDRAVVVGALST